MTLSNGPLGSPRTRMYISPGGGRVLKGLHHESTLPSAMIALGMRISTVMMTNPALTTASVKMMGRVVIRISPRAVLAHKVKVQKYIHPNYTISVYKMQGVIVNHFW